MKRIIGMLFSIAMLVMLFPITGQCKNVDCGWTKDGEVWRLQKEDGTDLTATMKDQILYIDGKGEVPSYTWAKSGLRPWNGLSLWRIEIGSGITSIGSHAFSDIETCFSVEFFASTYVEDATAFSNIASGALFTIKDLNITDTSTGKIRYTSLDSIAQMMACYDGLYSFRLQNMYMIQMARSTTSKPINHIAPLDAIRYVTNPKYPLINREVKISVDQNYGKRVSANITSPSPLVKDIFELYMDAYGYEYIGCYDIVHTMYYTTIKSADVPVQFTIDIPNAYKFQGREFALLQIAPGVVNILTDEDSDPNTLTFSTDYPTTVYALVYKDTFAGLLPQAQ